jgi:hypothetical protein
MTPCYRSYRNLFSITFWTEGWSLDWEFILYDRGFPKTPQDRITMARASLTKPTLSPDKPPEWRFYGPVKTPKAAAP